MGKDKLRRFEETKHFPNFFQYSYDEVRTGFPYQGKWHQKIFKNENPIVLEVGCGRAEYTTGLAQRFPNKNFIGIDRKGARLWKGGKTMLEEKLDNVGFIRTNIDLIDYFFGPNEVDEIWITFPDPQPKKERRRLTHTFYLDKYRKFLKPNAIIHLKTDSQELHEWTKEQLLDLAYPIFEASTDIYKENFTGPLTEIQTTYEKLFLKEGKTITYLRFGINK